MAAPWRSYLQRSMEHLRNRTQEGQSRLIGSLHGTNRLTQSDLELCPDVGWARHMTQNVLGTFPTVLRAQPMPTTSSVLKLASIESEQDLQQFAIGCDEDLGKSASWHCGYNTVTQTDIVTHARRQIYRPPRSRTRRQRQVVGHVVERVATWQAQGWGD